jgi:tetratricopeptide (TPR) repeat protein
MRRVPAVAIVFFAALLLRIGHVIEIRDTVMFRSPLVDAYVYDQAGRKIAEKGPAALEIPYYQPPLYPMFLGATYWASGGSLLPRILQAFLGAATVAIVFHLATRTGRGRAAWIASALLGLYGPILYFEGELLPTTLVIFLNTAGLALLLKAEENRRGTPGLAERSEARTKAAHRLLLVAGFLFGVSSAARPTGLILAAGAGVWWIAATAAASGRRTGRPTTLARVAARAAPMSLYAAAVLLPILPFTIANYVRGQEKLLLSYNGGINFYVGNGANSDSLTAIQPGYAWDRLQVEPHRAGVRSRAEESRYWVRRAIREALQDPKAWLGSLGRKIVRLFSARETKRNLDYEQWRRDSALLSLPLVSFSIVAPLSLLGFLVGRWERRAVALLAVALGSVVFQNLAFFVADRYRAEAVPVLCLLGGLGLDGWLSTSGRRKWNAALAAAGLAAFSQIDFLGEREIDRMRGAIDRGVALRRIGLNASAARAYREALALSPGDPDAHRLSGEIALEEGDYARAVAHYDEALAGAPDYLMALLGKAQALEKWGRLEEAEAVYRRTLEVDPWSYEVRLNFGVFLGMQGRTEEARRMFEEGMRLTPEKDRFLANLENLRRIEEARNRK